MGSLGQSDGIKSLFTYLDNATLHTFVLSLSTSDIVHLRSVLWQYKPYVERTETLKICKCVTKLPREKLPLLSHDMEGMWAVDGNQLCNL